MVEAKASGFSKRKFENSQKEYGNVKCALGSILSERHSEEIRTRIKNAIKERVDAGSRMAYKACILYNSLLIELCNTNNSPIIDPTEQNTFIQCFTQGCGRKKRRKPNPELETVWERLKASFLSLEERQRFKWDFNFINYLAKTYRTCFFNSLTTNFVNRQRVSIKRFIASQSSTSLSRTELGKVMWEIQKRINGWTKNTTTSTPMSIANTLNMEEDILMDYIDGHRKILGLAANKVIVKNLKPMIIVKYYHFILSETYPGTETWKKLRGFTLAPINKLKLHGITIDRIGVKSLKNTVGLTVDDDFSSLFDVSKIIRGGGRIFDHSINTDGVSCSVRYYKESAIPRSPQEKRRKMMTHPEDEKDPVVIDNYNNGDVIGIDPGRKNIAFCVRWDPRVKKVIEKKKLTSASYYCWSGMTRRNKREERRTKNSPCLKEYGEKMSEIGLKKGSNSISVSSWEAAIMTANEGVWAQKLNKRSARESFRVYCLKNKTLDTFVNSVMNKKKTKLMQHPVTIAYGAAKFSSTGRGEHFSSPTSIIKKKFIDACKKDAQLVDVDEYNTSKICYRCHGDLKIVLRKSQEINKNGTHETRVREVRGLRRCESSSCLRLGRPYLDRDLNAAANIAILSTNNGARISQYTRSHRWIKQSHLLVQKKVFGSCPTLDFEDDSTSL